MNKRRLGALAAATTLAASAVAAGGAAHAAEQRTEIFNAQAQATALHINVLGTDLTLSDTLANLDSTPQAKAITSEILTPLFSTQELTAEQIGGDGRIDQIGGDCLLAGLEAVPGLARISDAKCPTAWAEIKGGLPSAQALGAELKLDLSVSEILDTLQLRQTVGGTHDSDDANNDGLDDQLIDQLAPVTEALTGTPIEDLVDDTVTSVDQLLEDVIGLDTVVRLAIAPAVSETITTDSAVTAFAKAQALRIELLPVNDLGRFDGIVNDLNVGDPLLTIIISEAYGSQSYNRVTGKVEPAVGDAAVARIKIGPGLPLIDEQVLPLLDTIGLGGILAQASGAVQGIPGLEDAEVSLSADNRELVVKGPGALTVLEGTPLETTIVLSAVDLGADGFSGSGVKLHALKGVNGGLLTALSDIAGGGAAETKVLASQEAPRELARTGATPWIPLTGMALLALALGARRMVAVRTDR